MRILILGGDGYLGWPTAMRFSQRGHEVQVDVELMNKALLRTVRRGHWNFAGTHGSETFDFVDRPFAQFSKIGPRLDALG